MDDILGTLIRDLRNPTVDVAESEAALIEYIQSKQAVAWDEAYEQGARDADEGGDNAKNPYGDIPACTCGFGGFHDDINPRCERNQAATELRETLLNRSNR